MNNTGNNVMIADKNKHNNNDILKSIKYNIITWNYI